MGRKNKQSSVGNAVGVGDSDYVGPTFNEFMAECQCAWGTMQAMRLLYGKVDWPKKVEAFKPWIVERNKGVEFNINRLNELTTCEDIPVFPGCINAIRLVVFIGAYTEVCLNDLIEQMKTVAKHEK